MSDADADADADASAIKTARAFADKGDIRVGWFLLRDLEITKQAGFHDLAWSGHQHGVSEEELRWLISELEKFTAPKTALSK